MLPQIPKHIALHSGEQLFKGLLTATNEHKDIVQQFLLVTDSREQMLPMLQQLNESHRILGHPPFKYVVCDKARDEKPFWEMAFPALRAEFERLNSVLSSDAAARITHASRYPDMTIDMDHVRVYDTVYTINTAVEGMRCVVEGLPPNLHYVGLDTEWCVNKQAIDFTVQGRLDVITISYVHDIADDGQPLLYKTLVLQVSGLKHLPHRLYALLVDSNIRFVGCCVSADIKKIARDFNVPAVARHAEAINLGGEARKRDVIPSGTATLARIAELVLQQTLPKAGTPRFSDWSKKPLTKDQIRYAALDALASVRIHEELLHYPDLTLRLDPSDVVIGMRVDVVPSSGSVCVLGTRAASGEIAQTIDPHPHPKCPHVTILPKPGLIPVHVREVLAHGYILASPYSTKKTGITTLRDFGEPPFVLQAYFIINWLHKCSSPKMFRIFS